MVEKNRDEVDSDVSSSSSDSADDDEVDESALDLDNIVAAAVEKARGRYKAAAVTSIERTKLPPMPTPLSAFVSNPLFCTFCGHLSEILV